MLYLSFSFFGSIFGSIFKIFFPYKRLLTFLCMAADYNYYYDYLFAEFRLDYHLMLNDKAGGIEIPVYDNKKIQQS